MRLNIMLAAAAVFVAGASSGAMAQYVCPPGYGYYGGVCSPLNPPGYSNPVAGAVTGEAAGAASGYSVAGPIGAVVGGALGTATGTLAGTAGMLSPGCAYGYYYYNGACYPAR